jgi:DNA polymerase III delta prime subunit
MSNNRWFYKSTITDFLNSNEDQIIGAIASENPFCLETTQRDAWLEEIKILKKSLNDLTGSIFFEYSIPRLGKRVDVILIVNSVVFVLEFKVGAKNFKTSDIDQVCDYALDLANFHEESHNRYIVPILIATNDQSFPLITPELSSKNDKVFHPAFVNPAFLNELINKILLISNDSQIDISLWEKGRYCPTPTIVEAATALYNRHSVEEISRSDAGAKNLSLTSKTVAEIIKYSQKNSKKTICFVTGVPGAGKTLVGLNIATSHFNKKSELYSVFLSGNGPLVAVLREALARDKVSREKLEGNKISKKEAESEVQMFIQNVHHFRDDCLIDIEQAPIEHVALFDEAQRAWNLKQTADFMKRKKNRPNFNMSEPEFLISCLDRHKDWAVVVCLVGGGQEINRGEAGISEWVEAIKNSFPHWNICLSSQLTDTEYGAGKVLQKLSDKTNVTFKDELHLSVSMRSFRAENVSLLVKQLLDKNIEEARETYRKLNNYPIVLTRNLSTAKKWLKEKARGSERYGIIVSSQAERLKPYAIDIRPKVNPVHWFLNGKDDVRSSYYLEDVATEFHVQGLELDWACVTWDADFRPSENDWICKSFRGNKWINIKKESRKIYLKNAYRVLLTRARQGMIIVVPQGNNNDPTRLPEFYDPIFNYLKSIGFDIID